MAGQGSSLIALSESPFRPDTATGDLGSVLLGGTFSGLHGVALGPSGVVFVSGEDLTLYRIVGNSAVPLASLDPSPPIGPVGVAIAASGDFLVGHATAGLGRYSPTGSLLTGYRGGHLQLVIGVIVAPNGDIYVTDGGSFADGDNKVVKINPSSGAQELVASGGLLNAALPVDLARAATGEIYVTQGVSGPGAILKITPAGTVSELATDGLLSKPFGITFGAAGELIVTDGDRLIRIDPVTGAQTLFLAGGALTSPAGARRIEVSDLIFANGFE